MGRGQVAMIVTGGGVRNVTELSDSVLVTVERSDILVPTW